MPPPPPDDSPRWRVSQYEDAARAAGGLPAALTGASETPAGGITVLGSTLLADLRRVEQAGDGSEVLEVVAACLRHRESALIHLDDAGYVLPITVFPIQRLFHTPLQAEQWSALHWGRLRLIDVQPAVLRPPGHLYTDRVAATQRYGSLTILLWLLALHGPRKQLLPQIDERAAYRLTAGPELTALPLSGALGPAVDHLRTEAMTLRALARLPGMDVERASRLLNALYLQSALMVLRSSSGEPPARGAAAPGLIERIRSRFGGL